MKFVLHAIFLSSQSARDRLWQSGGAENRDNSPGPIATLTHHMAEQVCSARSERQSLAGKLRNTKRWQSIRSARSNREGYRASLSCRFRACIVGQKSELERLFSLGV
jgi:hypothetical protein